MSRVLDVVCLGKTTIDQFLILNELTMKYHLDPKTGFLSFKHGEKIAVEHSEFCVGGNATNVAVGLTRLGLNAGLFSEIGDDEFGYKIRHELEKEKIDPSSVIRIKGAPSSFSVIINFKSERTIFMQKIRRSHDFQFHGVSAKYVFLTSLEREWRMPYNNALAYVKENDCKLVFNPGTLQLHEGRDITLQVLKHTEVLFVNKEEAEEIVLGHEKRKRNNEIKYIRELLSKLKNMGVKVAVLTNGRYGSHVIDEQGNYFHEGLYSGMVVERTGAGDAYTTGFLAARIYGLPIKSCMKWGTINAASVVAKVGAVAGLLDKDALGRLAKTGVINPVSESKDIFSELGKAFERFKWGNGK